MNEKVIKYILDGWDKTVRRTEWEGAEFNEEGTLWLPHSFVVPCDNGIFYTMYYWDTYFAARGLLLSGRYDTVADIIKNFIYMIGKYGFILHASYKKMIARESSQPAFFGMLLADYLKATGDRELFSEGLKALKKELEFWYTRRTSENGLAHYGCSDDIESYIYIYDLYVERTGLVPIGEREYAARNIYAEAESGWDFCGRFCGKCFEYNAVDLNSLLWFDETLLAKYFPDENWAQRAEARKSKMRTLMRGEDGVFYDYSYVEGKRGALISCASFFPYFVGMIDDEKGIDALLKTLELDFGLQAADKSYGNFQWGADNGWACLQLVATEALLGIGRNRDALRVAKKYVDLVDKIFADTGRLWEKYNVREGSKDAVGEYGTPEMYGWTAGVYQTLSVLIDTQSC